jgi:hypothetical protein
VEYAIVALGAVVGLLVFAALAGGPHSPGMAPAAFVTGAAQRTLSQSTADVTMSGTVRLSGQTLAMGGNGQVDFATNAMLLNVGANMSDGSMTETELMAGGDLYLQVSSDGHNLFAAAEGRPWLEIPFSQPGSQTAVNGSPASSLSLLRQNGARVTPLGPASIGGQTCNGYRVTPSRRAMLAAAKAEYAKLGLSPALTNAALAALPAATPPAITAWFGSQDQLACQLSINIQLGAPTASGSGVAQMAMTFTHYGVPVQVIPPPSSETTSLQQLAKAARR